MEYKDTLNLPRTDFAMKADLVAREPERLKHWEAGRLYQRIQAARADAPKFVLHDGPPFANGDVHIGTALNKILKDIIVKYQTLQGRHAPYIPGWDCHGLPIEFKVSQDLRKAGDAATDPVAIRQACAAYARKHIDLQRGQFKRLGILADWENPYLTLNQDYEAEELRLFADLVQQGMVYRGKKPVYWSIPCRTALAEAEVEYHDHVSQSIYVKFPVVGEPDTFILIWTTTPWTLPANLAVACHQDLAYVKATVGKEHYLLARALLPEVAKKCGWTQPASEDFPAARLATIQYQHPFIPARLGRVLPAGFVTADTGTGFVHIAPGHGPDDYNLGRANGLPAYSPVNDEGTFALTDELPVDQQMPPSFLGKSILEKHGKSDANEVVLHELRLRQALLHQENHHHSYPHCWRSKTPVIFRAMDQWFVQLDHNQLRQRALQEIDAVKWIPDWGVNRIKSAVQSRPDWCISRQRAWGVPIPAFYAADGRPLLDPVIIRRVADLVEQHGSNLWFELSAAELWQRVRPAEWTGPEAVTKSSDTLDVWIDSGSSSRAVTARRAEIRGHPRPFQADVYLEGSDQHRGWFQSSLLLSLAANGAAPFKTVLTHGFMVDADREKISKSKQGAYEKPQTAEAYVKKYGADVVRLWVASQDYRNDIVVSEERINKVGETYRAIRNALRYQLSNLYDFDPARDRVPADRLTPLDRWILAAFSRLQQEVLAAFEAFEFHLVYQKLSQFTAVELSSIYHDVIKDRLYTDPAGSPRRRSTQTALHQLVTGLCQLLAPFLTFTADEAWEAIPGQKTASVHESQLAVSLFILAPAEIGQWEWLNQWRETLLPHLEKARQEKLIGKALDARIELVIPPEQQPHADAAQLRELLNVSALTLTVGPSAAFTVTKAAGQKCERCWHWESDVGENPDHPVICRRCTEAVLGFLAASRA